MIGNITEEFLIEVPAQTQAEEEAQKKREDFALALISNAISEIENEAKKLSHDAKWNRRNHVIFNTLIIVLGVAAPALVTFQTYVADPMFQLSAIALTAIVGATATLRGFFRFSEHFILDSKASLELKQLASETNSKLSTLIMSTNRDNEWYARIQTLNSSTLTKWQTIQTNHLQFLSEEITVVVETGGSLPELTSVSATQTVPNT